MALLETIQETADPQERRDLADTLIAEVMRHAVAEEMHVYPAVEKHVPNGKEEVEHDKKEHDELVDLMKRIEDLDSADPRFMPEVREMHALLSHHANDEETDQFPKLRQHIPREELVELREKVEAAMKAAPTRPHPSARTPSSSTRRSVPVSASSTGCATSSPAAIPTPDFPDQRRGPLPVGAVVACL